MVIGLIIAVVVGVLGGIGWFLYERNQTRKNLGYELTHEPLIIEDQQKLNYTPVPRSQTEIETFAHKPAPRFTPPSRPAEPTTVRYNSGGYVPSADRSDDNTSLLTTALVASTLFDSSPSPSYDSCGSSYDSGGSSFDSGGSCGSD